jgi:hypothetical protein
VYLFRPRTQTESADDPQAAASPFGQPLPGPASAAIQPGSAAEWALGELLIRLCNRGRALQTDLPEDSPAED